MPRVTYLHPDEACARLGLVPRPGEGKWAAYNRRRHLGELGLTKVTGPFKGYRYKAHEVDALAAIVLGEIPVEPKL
jgi:hypothetical protein